MTITWLSENRYSFRDPDYEGIYKMLGSVDRGVCLEFEKLSIVNMKGKDSLSEEQVIREIACRIISAKRPHSLAVVHKGKITFEWDGEPESPKPAV
jgi:hypothetical protein